jgi:hypothetical protein
VDVAILCAEEALAVGMAELTVTRAGDGSVVERRVMTVDEALGASAALDGLPPNDYVVWISATSEQGMPCAGSADLTVIAGQEIHLDILVECQR